MNIREANTKIKELENDYEYYLGEKENLLTMVLPKATKPKVDVVEGGKRVNNLELYAEKEEDKQINATLDYIEAKKRNLEEWVERELKIIGEYEPLKAKIILLRDKEKFTWERISEATHYSRNQCMRIYKRYTSKRDIY